MPFSPTKLANGQPNPASALELITVIAACYWNRPQSVAAVATALGGGSVRGFSYSPVTWPPSWTVVQSANTIVIAFAGTDNLAHIYGDCVGAFGTPYKGTSTQAHKFFLSSWQALSPTVTALMPPDVADCDLIFTGHSMGGAECSSPR